MAILLVSHTSMISIHTLRVEGDSSLGHDLGVSCGFQSTPSAWRVTSLQGSASTVGVLISIHTLRVEGDGDTLTERKIYAISIHTLRVEGDGPRLEGSGL